MAKTDLRVVVAGALVKSKGKPEVDVSGQVLTDLAAAGVELVADLPTAERAGDVLASSTLRVRPGTTAQQCRDMAAAWLATARLLEAEPAIDPADVDALAEQLQRLDDDNTGYQGLAQKLLRSGKVTVKR